MFCHNVFVKTVHGMNANNPSEKGNYRIAFNVLKTGHYYLFTLLYSMNYHFIQDHDMPTIYDYVFQAHSAYCCLHDLDVRGMTHEMSMQVIIIVKLGFKVQFKLKQMTLSSRGSLRAPRLYVWDPRKLPLLPISRLWRYCGPSNYRFNFLFYWYAP